jgi:hypothetical protein
MLCTERTGWNTMRLASWENSRMMRYCSGLAVVLIALTGSVLHAQTAAPVALSSVQRLRCTFTQRALGTWDKDVVPTVELTPAKLSMVFDAIDTQDGTANVTDVTAPDAGAPHITVRLLADNLHFLAMNVSGSVYLTTVFADKDSRAGGNFKAVHTRHEFTPTRLTGWTSRPEQYYGQCEAIKQER